METINVKGMSCGHCQKAVQNILESIEGVNQVEVSLEKDNASFELNKNVTVKEVIDKINETHYEASL